MVHTEIAPRAGGDSKEYDSHTLTILCKDITGIWYVARFIGVSEKKA